MTSSKRLTRGASTPSAIARKLYDDANKSPTLFEAGKPMLSDPNKINPGQKLRIPVAWPFWRLNHRKGPRGAFTLCASPVGAGVSTLRVHPVAEIKSLPDALK